MMVRPANRTRSTKKVKRRTPGGATKTHIRRRKPGKAKCGRCGRQLSGVAAGTPKQIRDMAKSSRTPARPYAGVLCTGCLDDLVRYVTRMQVKHTVQDYGDLRVQRDLTIEKYLPRGWWAAVTEGGILKRTVKSKPKRSRKEAPPKKKGKPKAKSKPKKKA
jgi:large subunit ribosomal protein L34e